MREGGLVTELASRAQRAVEIATVADREAATLHLLDTAGCIATGATHPIAARLRRHARRWDERGDTVCATLGSGVSLRQAVFADATVAHVDEYDAVHAASATVPPAVVIPAALLVGAALRRRGAELIDAMIAGYETVIEAGLRFGGSRLYERCWWPTPVFGALGSAVATARLLGLDRTGIEEALALAVTTQHGLLAQGDLADAHYLLAGRAAAVGVESAFHAAAGMRADPGILDGPGALALGAEPSAPSGLGAPHLTACVVKEFPFARPLHAVLVALDQLGADGVRVADATTVTVSLPRPVLRFVRTDRSPAGPAEAAASAAYAMSAQLARRARDVRFVRAAKPVGADVPEVVVLPDEELSERFPNQWGAKVATVVAGRSSIRTVEEVPAPRTLEEVRGKFRRQCASNEVSGDRCERRCLDVGRLDDITDLLSELVDLGQAAVAAGERVTT